VPGDQATYCLCSLYRERSGEFESALFAAEAARLESAEFGTGHEGILRFSQEVVNAVVVDLNDDGSEAALIIAELKRLRPEVSVILMKGENVLAQGATKQASAVVLKSQEVVNLVRAPKAVMPPRSRSKS
jgi:DNA-binding NarL/FixJ family response regulator